MTELDAAAAEAAALEALADAAEREARAAAEERRARAELEAAAELRARAERDLSDLRAQIAAFSSRSEGEEAMKREINRALLRESRRCQAARRRADEARLQAAGAGGAGRRPA